MKEQFSPFARRYAGGPRFFGVLMCGDLRDRVAVPADPPAGLFPGPLGQ